MKKVAQSLLSNQNLRSRTALDPLAVETGEAYTPWEN